MALLAIPIKGRLAKAAQSAWVNVSPATYGANFASRLKAAMLAVNCVLILSRCCSLRAGALKKAAPYSWRAAISMCQSM